MDNPFKKAEARKLKLKLLLLGESGTGKTWWSLSLATRLIDLEGGKIAFIDTEGADGKAQLYAPYFDFDHMTISDHSPESYCKAISAAIQFKYTVIIVDSFSQAWNGKNGVLEITDKAKTGWAESKPRHRKLIDTIHDSKIHIIGTARTKNSYAKTESGAIDWKNSSIEARQEPEFEYEWDMSAILDHDHALTIRKSRCFEIPDGTTFKSDEEQTQFVFQLNTWLNAGIEPPHWTENPRQMSRVNAWLDKAKNVDKFKLHLAGAIADTDRKAPATPEAFIDVIKQYCTPEAALARATAIENRRTQKQSNKIKDFPALVANQPEADSSSQENIFADLMPANAT